ncbi:MAG: peptidylprolyl isomerase [Myxococcota bacterium]
MTAAADRLGPWLLAAGALAGVGLAGASLLERQAAPAELPEGVVAVVDGRPILRSEYERALRALSADRDGPLTEEDRRHVLDRLIDEELLVQHGLELGIARRDRRVRADLSAAVIALVTARAEDDAEDVTDEELRRFFERHRAWFRTRPRLHVEQLFFRAADSGDAAARERAAAAAARWTERGGPAGALRDDADAYDVPLPDGPVPLGKLEDYLGPTVARGLASAEAGEVVGPLRSGSGYHVVRVVERLPGEVPSFERVRPLVRAEHRRRLGEERLRDLLEARRADSEVRVARGVP